MRHLSATMTAKNTLWMCVALTAAILAAWLVVVLATPTKRAEAAFPGQNGKIAFVSDLGDLEIVTMNANGDNKTNLTNNRARDAGPAFSANGKKIAFTSGPLQSADIFTMSATGTDKKRVTTGESREADPAWSPDGTKIAFESKRNGNSDIYVINQDGSGLTRLTTSPKRDASPAWSPDGTRIAFRGGDKIYVMKAARVSETNIPKRLTTSGSDVKESEPAWSPNGTRIAFIGNSDRSNIYAIRADGSDLIQLTTALADRELAWSPDGTKIAFRRVNKIFVMKAAPQSETNRPKQLTSTGSPSFEPDWQPLR